MSRYTRLERWWKTCGVFRWINLIFFLSKTQIEDGVLAPLRENPSKNTKVRREMRSTQAGAAISITKFPPKSVHGGSSGYLAMIGPYYINLCLFFDYYRNVVCFYTCFMLWDPYDNIFSRHLSRHGRIWRVDPTMGHICMSVAGWFTYSDVMGMSVDPPLWRRWITGCWHC